MPILILRQVQIIITHPVLFQKIVLDLSNPDYRTRAIISRGLYIFYPIFKDHFFVFKEVFSENYVLMYGLYSRGASNQEWLMMACLRYIDCDPPQPWTL